MAGPRRPDEALNWIQEALQAGRYIPVPHFFEREELRDIDWQDVEAAIFRATGCWEYERGTPRNGGTCWRVEGSDLDGTRIIGVGVEAFLDKKRRRIIVVTVVIERVLP